MYNNNRERKGTLARYAQNVLLMMKLITLVLIAGLMQLSAATFGQRVSLTVRNESLTAVFKQISKQTGYGFVLSNRMMKDARPVSADLKDVALDEALTFLFEHQPFTYSVEDNVVRVSRKELRDNASAAAPKGSGMVVAFTEARGMVVDSIGQPLEGASVRVVNTDGKRTSLLTKTDKKGEFVLRNVPIEAKLEVSFIGFVPRIINAAENVGHVVLVPTNSVLDAVVVMAYGTTTQRLNTGNISKVTATDIANHPVSNVLGTLDGMVPGMIVTQSNGLPGASFKVQVRGRTAIDQNITDDQPLFIIDGVPYAPNNSHFTRVGSALGTPGSLTATYPGGLSPLNLINPQDIESVEVLKDADATAIYGSRGANGVVLITTKRAALSAERTEFNFQSYQGVSMVPNKVEMMDVSQYVQLRKKAFEFDGVTPTQANAYDILLWDTTYNNNLFDAIFGNNARTQDYQFGVMGGNRHTSVSLRGNFHRENNMFSTDKSDNRGSLAISIGHQSKDGRFNVLLSGSYTANSNNQITGNMGQNYSRMPHQRFLDDQGELLWEQDGISLTNNALAILNTSYLAKTKAVLGNLQVNYEVIKGLNAKLSAGYNDVSVDEKSLRFSKAAADGRRFADFSAGSNGSWILEPQLEYKRTIGLSQMTLLVGGTWQQNANNSTYNQASGFTNDALMNSLTNATSVSSSRRSEEYRYAAGFARVTLHHDSKYLLNASVRRDGSSRFGPGKQLATFGAVGAGWIFSEEIWLKEHLSVLSFGKLRGSYGITGNDKITNYQYLDTWESARDIYGEIKGLFPDKLYNPDYRWERTEKLEGGLETGFLRDRIMLSASYYSNTSSNQLINYKLPRITGFSDVVANLNATIRNSGWEFTLNTKNIVSPSFSWSSSVNISLPKNKLVSFPNLATSSYANRYIIGQPLNITNALYQYTGLDPETGVHTAVDVDKNGSYTVADRTERVILDATMFGGFKNTLTYKDFGLDFLFSFRAQKASTGLSYLNNIGLLGTNLPKKAFDKIWLSPASTDAVLAKPSQNRNSPTSQSTTLYRTSAAAYGDASFIRLRNVSLSYLLPERYVKHLHVGGVRCYVQAENLFKLSNYELGDPEVGAFYIVPPLRTFVFGLQVTLH